MSANDQTARIERIHATGKRMVLAVTGGGSGAISALLSVPGASASVLEGIVPYAATALDAWLGGPPDRYCSERTARAMAMAAFQRAHALCDSGSRTLIGLGATASLASNRPKRGPHRVYVAWQSADTTSALACELTKGARARAAEEEVATALVLDAVADATGVDSTLSAQRLATEPIARRRKRAPVEWTRLLLGELPMLALPSESDTSLFAMSQDDPARPVRIVFPGAFNPVHFGHEQMARIAGDRYALPVSFELSMTNVDKPPLDFIELDERLHHLAGKRVIVTRAPTFVEKARLLPNSIFVVGADTIARIAEPRYYDDDPGRREAAISAIDASHCRFLVFGRREGGRFVSLSDLDLPPSLAALCDEVPEALFRADISSTELRRAEQQFAEAER